MKTTAILSFLTLVCLLLLTCNPSYGQKNIIKTNHTFLKKTIDWEKGTWGDERSRPEGAIFSDSTAGHDDKFSVKVKVSKATKDDPSKIFLRRKEIKLKKGKKYQLSFWVKSKIADDSVKLLIYSSEETGSTKEWGGVVDTAIHFLGDGTWQQVTHIFKAKDKFPGAPADFGSLGISIGFGNRKGICNIDNFKLIRIDD